MPTKDEKIFKKFANLYSSQDKFTEAMINHPDINIMQKRNPKMAKLTLDGYWKYYRELSQAERSSKKVSDFVHAYVSKHIYEDLT